jgi:uncharacterized coiled-coil DUF342 family protein
MAKYDILNQFVDMAGKYRVIVENENTNDVFRFKFDHDPTNKEIREQIKMIDDRRASKADEREEIQRLKDKKEEINLRIDELQAIIDSL